MQVLRAAAAAGTVAPVSIVMLPAAYAAAADFEREGFAAAVRARRLGLDLAFVAPELRHATDRAPLDAAARRDHRARRARRVSRCGSAGSRSAATWRCATRRSTRMSSPGCACSRPTSAAT